MQKPSIPIPPYQEAVEIIFGGSEIGLDREIYAMPGPEHHAAIRIFFKGHYKDGTEHYEVAIDRVLLAEAEKERQEALCSRREQ